MKRCVKVEATNKQYVNDADAESYRPSASFEVYLNQL